MASAALNSGLLEALVSRGGAATQPSEGQPTSPHDPSAAHHAYLQAHFQGLASHYGGSGDLHDMSTSGGDVTTEEEDASLNEHFSHYYRTAGDDLLSASAKKRRKQSKPVRLPTPQGQAGDPFHVKAEESQFDSEVSNPSADGDEGYTCPHCHAHAASDDALRRHIIEEHIGRLLNDDDSRQQQQQQQPQQQQEQQQQRERLKGEEGSVPLNLSSPRWEERPASRPREEDTRSPPTSIPMPPSFGDMKFSLPGLLPLGPPPFLLPFLQQAEHERLSAGLHSGSPSSSSGHGQHSRIFNQEAYCDLCNKEFCNKYFLKTHKANKHGIYSPEISSSPTGLPAGHSTPLGPSVPLASPLGPALGPGGFIGSPYAGAFIAANMTNLPLRPPLLSQVSSAKNMPLDKSEFDSGGGGSSSGVGGGDGGGGGGSSSISISGGGGVAGGGGGSGGGGGGGGAGGVSSSSSSSGKAGGVINLEAYCELCQKEFCNKYFLKRHKSKIHGIMIDVVTKPKNPGQMPPRVAPDRPEGWCDACRRDIGGRAALNAHKLQVHGPHIVAPLSSPHSNSPHTHRNPRTPTPKDGRKDGQEHRELRDYFSPWEVFRDSREAGRELWESGKDVNELVRDPARSTARSPWDRPLGSPWDAIKVPEGLKESSKEAVLRGDHWSEPSSSDHQSLREDRAALVHFSRLTNSHDFPLDSRETQSLREQQQREWELQHQRSLEHHHRERAMQQQKQQQEQQQPQRQDLHYREQDRELERELQARERDGWSQEREQKHYRDKQMEAEQYEQQERAHGAEQQQHYTEIETETLIKSETSFHDGDEAGEMKCHQSEQSDEPRSQVGKTDEEQLEEDPEAHSSGEHKTCGPEDGDFKPREGSHDGHDEKVESGEKDSERKDLTSGSREVRDDIRETEHEEREVKPGTREGCLDVREPFREGHRTPGSSSADESSRDTGIIARVGQPAMVQAPPGTKFTPEQLRQLGVINPDAFCELCCKEFCNKYFLRTHRIKKHGIYTPEFSERSKSQSKENSSLNLTRLLERQSLDVRPPIQDLEGDLECEICRRPFPTPYHLQMHKYYFHGPGQEAISPQETALALHPHPLPHEQLRQLALHAQQQARSQQSHQKRMQEQQRRLQDQQRRLQEHQQRLQKHQQQQQQHQQQQQQQQQQQHQEGQREAASQEERHQADEGGTGKAEEPSRPSVIESANSGESDASEDLRKLQSMILQLNRQGEVSVRCRVCTKELGNKYFLRAHMMTEHGVLGHDEVSGPPSEGAQTPKTPKEAAPKISPPSTPFAAENQAFCTICKKDFFSRYILQQHLLSAHGVFTPPAPPTSFMERIKAEVEGREERKPQSTSRSYCEICNKELCNKYFMKTHMLKMHGINVENGVTGGVTCDLCNKELCSKYFLRVHKQNTHGMVEEGREGDEGINKFEIELCPMCTRRFKNRKWLKTHLTSDHDEAGKEKWREMEASWREAPPPVHGLSCVLCGHVLPDMVALQVHIIKVHSPQDSAPDEDSRTTPDEAKDDALKCSFCPFTAPNPTLLFAHSRTHVPGVSTFSGVLSQTLPCSLCAQVFSGLEAYQNHLLQHHLQGLFKPLLEKEDNQEERKVTASPEVPEESTAGHTSQTLRRRKRWRCSQCGRRFKSRALCLAHVHASHNPRARGTWLGRAAIHRRLYKCRKCGAMASRLTELRQHIREQHGSREGVPTSHATPTKPTSGGRFVMQPFLLNDSRGGEDGREQEGRGDEQQFVPSLVYLPVARRVHHPLTVSFSLTPA